ncbi:MAG: SpoIIE family protein phosphatase, partial [Solirubrobacteraceae bacterium]
LLVDDRLENLTALEAVLRPLGYPVRTAASGAGALRLLLEQDFALILLDVRMPGLDGVETARLIKSRVRTRDVPIVFLTAARDEVADVIRGYGVGAIDYVLKPVDPELLRSKVAVFVELEASRRALRQSESFLRGAFEAAPIGKTVLDGDRRIVRSNPAFARAIGREPAELHGIAVAELCHEQDREQLSRVLAAVARQPPGDAPAREEVDLRLRTSTGAELWVGLVASSIQTAELTEVLLLAQWVDLSARRRAEQARAELLLEQAARTHAEAMAARMQRLQALGGALESLALEELLPELAKQLVQMFDAQAAEVKIAGADGKPVVVVARDRRLQPVAGDAEPLASAGAAEVALAIDGIALGTLRVAPASGRSLASTDSLLLAEVADRAALSIRRAQLHEHEHWIAVELQRGLLPKRLPAVAGIELATRYQVAGLAAEAGGDWYDAFPLRRGRIGVVVGDVAGRGIPAASAMGQLRSVTRAFALADDGIGTPGQVLTRLNRHQLALGLEDLFTVTYAVVDPRSQAVSWANAGHPPPLVRTAAGVTSYLEGGEGLMGMQDAEYRTLDARLREGDMLILYTDGLVERRGESLDVGLARLAVAAANGPGDPQRMCDRLVELVVSDDKQLQDDVTVLVVKVSTAP